MLVCDWEMLERKGLFVESVVGLKSLGKLCGIVGVEVMWEK